MRIHAMTTDRGGCFEHRIALPLAHLGRRGHETTYGNGVSAAVLNELAARPDSVLIAKFVTEDAAVDAWEQIAAAPRRPALMVYDVDDSYYHVGEIYTGDRSVYAKPETIARSERMMRAADLVTCTTLSLAALYSPLGTPVAVLPNAVADEILDWQVRTPPRRFTVGYQGSPSHLHDMQYWVGAFDAFMGATDARWHWFGIHDPQCWPKDRQRVTQWTNDPEEFHRSLNGKFHVGVAPLHPELTFNSYKSGLKAQVYAALGRPTVASDFSFYADVIRHGETGFLAGSAQEWTDALMELYRDPHTATVMGMNARELESTRTMSKVVHRWEDAYREALP
jgi:glycosyltransferase involved in cell wall biosynthesis